MIKRFSVVAALLLVASCCTITYAAEYLGRDADKYRFFDNGIERTCTQPELMPDGRNAVTECTTGDKTYLCLALPDYMGYLDCNPVPLVPVRLTPLSEYI